MDYNNIKDRQIKRGKRWRQWEGNVGKITGQRMAVIKLWEWKLQTNSTEQDEEEDWVSHVVTFKNSVFVWLLTVEGMLLYIFKFNFVKLRVLMESNYLKA